MWHQNTEYLNKKVRIPGYQNPLPSLKKRREKQEQEKQQQQQQQNQFISVIIRNCFIRDNLTESEIKFKERKKEKRKRKTPSYPVPFGK